MPAALFMVLTAPFLGSFVATLALRYPDLRSVVWGRSRCPTCHHALESSDLIPLVSWVAMAGECRHCRGPISVFYPAVELLFLACAASSLYMAPDLGSAILLYALAAFLLWGAATDALYRRIPNLATLSVAALGFFAILCTTPDLLVVRLAGALAGFTALTVVRQLYRRLRARDGLGWGDIKLVAALGLWIDGHSLPATLLIASLAALLTVAARHIAKKTSSEGQGAVAFGPFIAAAAWIVIVLQYA